ncbi:thioredoxin [Streptomyces phage Lannister]|uniref:Thioredoxin n=1 Tax=Streptomyces phage Lannister TaxID=1674927 RepID=A0A0K1Y9C9_9CAUD|nr:thioredoxin [Streptomyces phage Lannister]AKY03687.1 thioredoxin [Streptomyces phage Lannister]
MLYFSSPWCRPCRSFGPLLTKELEARSVEPERIDVTQNVEMANLFEVSAVPTVVFIRDGEEISRFTGALLGPDLKDALSVLD